MGGRNDQMEVEEEELVDDNSGGRSGLIWVGPSDVQGSFSFGEMRWCRGWVRTCVSFCR